MDENKIERVANATARNYALDGYRLLDYEFNENSQLAVYQMRHNNGNGGIRHSFNFVLVHNLYLER